MASSSVYQDMRFFPRLVHTYSKIFTSFSPEIGSAIFMNFGTLKTMAINDKKEEARFYEANRSQNVLSMTRCESTADQVRLYVGGAKALLQVAQSYLLNFTKAQKQVVKLLEDLGDIGKTIMKIIIFIQEGLKMPGNQSFSIFLNELTVECYDAMGSVISILRHLTNMMNICFFIDRRLLSHSLSAMSNLTEGTKLRSQRRSILPSDVDTLTDHFEVVYSDIIEFSYRLILARRDPNYPSHNVFKMQMEEATKESEIVKRKMQKALAKSMEYKRIDEEELDAPINETKSCSKNLSIANRFTREYQVYNQTRQLRKRLRGIDDILLELELHGEQIAFKNQETVENSQDFKEFLKRREDIENLLNSFTLEANRYICYIDTLKRTDLVISEKLPSQNSGAVISDKVESSEFSRPPTPCETEDDNLTFEPYNCNNDDEDEDETIDEFFYGRGKLGEDLNGPEFDSEQPAEKLKGLVYSGVLTELKSKLTDRKVEMRCREQTALKKAHSELMSSESESEGESDVVKQQSRNEMSTKEIIFTVSGNSPFEENAPMYQIEQNPRSTSSVPSFQNDLLRAINARKNASTDVFEYGENIDEESYEEN